MGKKKDKKKQKVTGAEKTAMKTEKKADKKAKKKLAEKGEEDIEALIAEFQARDKKQSEVQEERVPPPTPRCNLSLTPHPDKDELIMFGGEFFNGNKTFMYNDLLLYNIKSGEWSQLRSPGAPPPRCAHQAVILRQGGGQLWIFGGEFASPTQSQFYHYKDLWVFHIKEKQWEKIKATGGPSARSGHRMTVFKRQIIVFGGFHDNVRDYKYFNDVFAFDLDTYTWSQLEPSGTAPCPRSGCQLAVTQDQTRIVVYGGYSKERVKKDVDLGKTHTDMLILAPEGKSKEEGAPVKWKWQPIKQSGVRPGPRSGFSLTVTPGNRALLFGGVFDEEEDEESVEGTFYNEMYSLELDKGKWHEILLRGNQEEKERKKRRRKKEKGEGDGEKAGEEEGEKSEEEEVGEDVEEDLEKLQMSDVTKTSEDGVFTVTQGPQTTYDDGVFTVTMGDQNSSQPQGENAGGSGGDSTQANPLSGPSPRMNTLLAVKNGILYLYGGLVEEGDKQLTLSDMYSLDLHKLDKWNTLIANNLQKMQWEDSDSSSSDDDKDESTSKGARAKRKKVTDDEDEESDDTDSSDEDDEEEEGDIMEEDPPAIRRNESATDYFSRTKDFWLDRADHVASQEGLTVTAKQMKKAALRMSEEFFNNEQKKDS